MAFDNKYPKRKDWIKPFYGSKAFDTSCRNNGNCAYCKGNRTINRKKIELAIKYEILNNNN